jgi:Zn-dependent M28 family amino/carboxypeptidase
VGAHYDTKDLPGFVGANDGAGGTAVVVELARALARRPPAHDVTFILFDGEESPAGTSDARFAAEGLRGSRVAARRLGEADAMVLIDFVADRDLSLPREENSNPQLWERLRAAARRVGVGCVFPPREQPAVTDDHVPFLDRGVPSVNLIDFDFPCWHRSCDDLTAVSPRSVDAVGEAVLELLRRP